MYIIIIQARMGSSRLPGKVLKKLLNKEVFLWSYDRSVKSNAYAVYMATSTNIENDILEELFIKNNIKFFRGSENDLLDRYYQLCIHFYKNELEDLKIIRVTSDCPFVDTIMINEMIDYYENSNYNYIVNHSKNAITPEGSGIEIIDFKSLEYLWKNNDSAEFREHVVGKLRTTNEYDEIIKRGEYLYLPSNVDIDKMRNVKISIDTETEYILSLEIVNYFKKYDFKYSDVLKYLQNKT